MLQVYVFQSAKVRVEVEDGAGRVEFHGRCGGLMVSSLDSRSSSPGLSPAGSMHCVFGQNTLLS